MAGRSFQVSVGGLGKRQVQERLARAPGVLDATIQGGAVRIVMDEAKTPETAQLLPGADDATITAAAPRFEDSFVALLRERLPALPPPAAPAPARAAAAGSDVIVVQHLRAVLARSGQWTILASRCT